MVVVHLKDSQVYQLKVTLEGVAPAVWRRLHVRSDISLNRLHRVLQVAIGWKDRHRHQFLVDGVQYGEPEDNFDVTTRDDRRARLGRVVRGEHATFVYEYGLGDRWKHSIAVERVLNPPAELLYPTCLAGERACPPDECTGAAAYAALLDGLRAPESQQCAETRASLEGPFDPEAFDREAVNAALRRIK